MPASVIGIDGRAFNWLVIGSGYDASYHFGTSHPGRPRSLVENRCEMPNVRYRYGVLIGTHTMLRWRKEEGRSSQGQYAAHVCVTMLCRLRGRCGEGAFALQASSTFLGRYEAACARTKGGVGPWMLLADISSPGPARASFVPSRLPFCRTHCTAQYENILATHWPFLGSSCAGWPEPGAEEHENPLAAWLRCCLGARAYSVQYR